MTATKHIDHLRVLRETFLAERRTIVSQTLADPTATAVAAGDFMILQSFLDAIEAAMAHEQHLARPAGAWPTRPPLGATMQG